MTTRIEPGNVWNKDKKEEEQELLESIHQEEISCVEEMLIGAEGNSGESPYLCSQHARNIKAQLDPGHVIHTMISEHDMILKFLDDLEAVNRSIQTMDRYDAKGAEFEKLKSIASHLIGAEAHHRREEEVLFPEVERRGIMGPPEVMRMEHRDLRKRKAQLNDLALSFAENHFELHKRALHPAAKGLALALRDHIFKENNILYPMALRIIPEASDWARMKAACDKIGYCCFTLRV